MVARLELSVSKSGIYAHIGVMTPRVDRTTGGQSFRRKIQ
jgi:hypothetical protein